MSVIRVGSSSKYAEGWAAIFGGKAAKKTTQRSAAKKAKPAGKKAVAKKAKKKRK